MLTILLAYLDNCRERSRCTQFYRFFSIHTFCFLHCRSLFFFIFFFRCGSFVSDNCLWPFQFLVSHICGAPLYSKWKKKSFHRWCKHLQATQKSYDKSWSLYVLYLQNTYNNLFWDILIQKSMAFSFEFLSFFPPLHLCQSKAKNQNRFKTLMALHIYSAKQKNQIVHNSPLHIKFYFQMNDAYQIAWQRSKFKRSIDYSTTKKKKLTN